MNTPKITVCLDAGHYGKYNRSPAVKTYYESEAMWKLHLLLKAALERWGIRVITTRENRKKDREVFSRGYASKGCQLFLSLHSNAVGSKVNESVDYPVAYHLTDDTSTDIDDTSKALAKLLAPVIAATMGTRQPGQAKSRLASGDKNKDGVKNDNYYGVLNGARQAGTPGLILEHSFHTNTRATQWLLDESNLEKLAQAEARVIAAFFGLGEQTLAGIYTVASSDGELNLRTAPGVENALVETMKSGTLVGSFGNAQGDWIEAVSQAGNVGWCHRGYLIRKEETGDK